MSARRIPDGAGRVSVDLTPDGPVLTCDLGGGDVVAFEILPDGSAVELAACFFFVAMLQDELKDPEKLTERFGRILNDKSAAYVRAQAQAAIKRGPPH